MQRTNAIAHTTDCTILHGVPFEYSLYQSFFGAGVDARISIARNMRLRTSSYTVICVANTPVPPNMRDR